MTWRVTIAMVFLVAFAPSGVAQEKKGAEEKAPATQPPTLKELQGLWIVDIEKLADTDHFKKHPDELPSARKWMTKESLEISETKILRRFGERLQEMTIKDEKTGATSISIKTHMKSKDKDGTFEVPEFWVQVFRRADGTFEAKFPNDLITRPLKQKPTK